MLLPLLALAGYWAVLIYYLGAQWSVYEQYHYGWAVPLLCGYLIWRNYTERQSTVHGPQSTAGEGRGAKSEVRGPALSNAEILKCLPRGLWTVDCGPWTTD